MSGITYSVVRLSIANLKISRCKSLISKVSFGVWRLLRGNNFGVWRLLVVLHIHQYLAVGNKSECLIRKIHSNSPYIAIQWTITNRCSLLLVSEANNERGQLSCYLNFVSVSLLSKLWSDYLSTAYFHPRTIINCRFYPCSYLLTTKFFQTSLLLLLINVRFLYASYAVSHRSQFRFSCLTKWIVTNLLLSTYIARIATNKCS